MLRQNGLVTGAAHPLTTEDPDAPLTDLEPIRAVVGDAQVVGVARGTHGARQLTRLTHRLLRFLVEQLGFRSLAIEAPWTTGLEVDAWLQTGRGESIDRLGDTASWWRTSEFVAVLAWMRAYNVHHSDDPVRLLGLDVAADDMGVLERLMARNVLSWQMSTGHKVLYWSGSHSAVGHARTVAWAPNEAGVTGRNSGSYLREQLGSDYVSAALTFDHGSVELGGRPVLVPAAPADFTDAVLAESGLERYLLDLRAPTSSTTRTIAASPARLRLIGPDFDAAQPASMTGGSLSELFDIVLHTSHVTPTTAASHTSIVAPHSPG